MIHKGQASMPAGQGKGSWRAHLPSDLIKLLERVRPFLKGGEGVDKSELTEQAFMQLLENDPEIREIIKRHSLADDLNFTISED